MSFTRQSCDQQCCLAWAIGWRGVGRSRVATADALRRSSLRPILSADGDSAHHLFPVEATRGAAGEVVDALARLGVNAARHYPRLCPEQPAARSLGEALDPLTVAHRIAEREVSLPIHPQLHDDELERVIEACLEIDR